MSLQATASGERVHIAFFGKRNAGKSSLLNAVTAQEIAVVSSVKGTTTDPVVKAMELLPLGPVVMIDTPGLDDEGDLGEMRVKKAKQVLDKTDIAVLVIDASVGMSGEDRAIEEIFKARRIPYLIVYNKADTITERTPDLFYVSAQTGEGVEQIKEALGKFAERLKNEKVIVSDLIKAQDIVYLVTPIDESAPKGRLILPQQMTLRELLDAHAIVITLQPEELESALERVTPALVITDSQVFGEVAKILPKDIPLTSFSMLMARYKGELTTLLDAVQTLSALKDGDKVLISEGCTHHRQCNDIGTVKMPRWIREYSKANLTFAFTSGGEFPDDLSEYALIVHCGGCMISATEMQNRIAKAKAMGVPMINYGMAIAHINGILERSLAPLYNKKD